MLRLPDRWVWDFWLATRGDEHHVFYLQAPRALGDPDLRHGNATVGHAVSRDLRDWTVLPDALRPGARDAWDDRATWTGSVIEHDRRWWCFYTGTSVEEEGLIQRVGAAVSDDLVRWSKHPANPLIELDPARYESLDEQVWFEETWRDPWVMRLDGRFHAFLTARSTTGSADARGVIAHAYSHDLERWEVREPIRLEPEHQYGHLEVPQIVELGGRWYLLFCVSAEMHSAAWRERTGHEPRTGTYYGVAAAPTGPYRLVDSEPLGPADGTTCFAGRVVQTAGGPRYLAWRERDAAGAFVGELIDPLPVLVGPDGRLKLGTEVKA
jgi:beta-fructofuranosidase